MITVEIVVSQKMSKSFFKKLFKTTRIMEGLAVMIAVERQPFKNFCSNLKVWMSNII